MVTAPIDKSCKEFDVSRKEISALKTSFALDSQKNSKKQRIRGITTQSQTQEEACRIIGSNSTSHFCTIESHDDEP